MPPRREGGIDNRSQYGAEKSFGGSYFFFFFNGGWRREKPVDVTAQPDKLRSVVQGLWIPS